jgi:hypothetical protein
MSVLVLLRKYGADFDLMNTSGLPCAGNYLTNTANELDYVLTNSFNAKIVLDRCPFPHGRDVILEVITKLAYSGDCYLAESLKIIKVLIKHGFDLNIKTKIKNETPLKVLNNKIRELKNKNNLDKRELTKLQVYKDIKKCLISNGACL